MKKTILLFTTFLLSTFVVNAQYFDWVKSIPSMKRGNPAIAIDNWSNVFITGRIVDFDNSYSTTYEIFIKKFDSTGILLWEKRMGGSGYDEGTSIAVDSLGNVYTSGSFSGTVDFDPNEGIVNLTSSDNRDSFIQKLDANGNLIWAQVLNVEITSLSTDGKGNIYTSGYFYSPTDFDPNEDTVTLSGSGIFVQKLDTNSKFLWVKKLEEDDSITDKETFAIEVDNLNHVYIGVSKVYYGYKLRSQENISIYKLDTNGNLIWNKILENTFIITTDIRFDLTIDSNGNIFTTGSFDETVDFDPNHGIAELTASSKHGGDAFIQKLDSSGNFLWAKNISGGGSSIVTDKAGNVYTTGMFEGKVNFNPNTDTLYLTALWRDVFIQKLDSNGDFLWAKSIAASKVNDIAIDNFGKIYIAGTFHKIVDFNPNAETHFLTSSNHHDVFLQKFSKKQKIEAPLGIKDYNVKQIKLYPNPASEFINIELPPNVEYKVTDIRIIDYLGNEAQHKRLKNTTKVIDISHLSTGIYYLNLILGTGETHFRKIFVSK